MFRMLFRQGLVKYIFLPISFRAFRFNLLSFVFLLLPKSSFSKLLFFSPLYPFPFRFYFFLSFSSAFFLPFLPSPFLFSSSYALAPFSIPYTLSSPGTFVLTLFSPSLAQSFFFLLLSPLASIATLLSGS
jgi:hypothetical protein